MHGGDNGITIQQIISGVDYLNETFLIPLKDGAISIESVRQELIRRSATLFAARLPNLQIHHGRDDVIVAVAQSESLMRALTEIDPSATSFEVFIYEVGGHHPAMLEGSWGRAESFLSELWETVVVTNQTH